jgi:hypothetical protein
MTESMSIQSDQAQLVDPLVMLPSQTSRALFWRPAYLESSPWLHHIPFAFWLVEALKPKVFVELGSHCGSAYFAFCQAVERLSLDTRCFAIEARRETGVDADLYEQVRAYNEAQYSSFSRLVRNSFDDAARHFSDGSIDLLHLDGLHTIEAVRHDLETWRPKLSTRAVVLFHGTNIREHESGVFRIIDELRWNYPVFEFDHGEGLAVVGLGPDQGEFMRRLFAAHEHDEAKRRVSDIFSRLGKCCADTLLTRVLRERSKTAKEEAEQYKKQLNELRTVHGALAKSTESQAQELFRTQESLSALRNHSISEKTQLQEQIALLNGVREDARADASRLKSQVDQLQAECSALLRAKDEAAQTRQELFAETTRLKTALDAALHQERGARESAATLGEQLRQAQQALTAAREEAREKAGQQAAANEALGRQIDALRAELQQACSAADQALRAKAQEAADMKGELDKARTAWAGESAGLKASLVKAAAARDLAEKTLKEAKVLHEQKQQERFAAWAGESAGLKASLVKAAAARDLAEKTLKEAKVLHEQKQQERFAESAKLTLLLQAAEQKRTTLAEELAQARAGAEKSCAQAQAQIDRTRREMADAKSDAERKTQDRFREIAKLTDLLQASEQRVVALQSEVLNTERKHQNLKKSFSWRVTAPLRALSRPLWKDRSNDAIESQCKLIADSGVFDKEWYLRRYPDVATSKMDPIEHYLRHGAREGRDPNPKLVLAPWNETGGNPLLNHIAGLKKPT